MTGIDRCLPVPDATELLEQAGDDARRRHVRDPAEEDGGERAPAEQQPGDEPRHHVGDEVDDAGQAVGPQPAEELGGRVLQPEHDEQEHHTDVRADSDEVLRRLHAALADGQPGEQVQRDGRDADPVGQPAEHSQEQQERPELDEHRAGRAGGDQGGDHPSSRRSAASTAASVPISNTTSPGSST